MSKSRRNLSARTARVVRALCVLGPALWLSACGGGDAGSGPGAAIPAAAATPGEARVGILSSKGEGSTVVDPTPSNDLKVVALTKVSETRVGRTSFDYVLKVTLRNSSGFSYSNVALSLVGAAPGTTIIDGAAALGSIAANSETVVGDTITIRQDRTVAFDLAALQWQITATSGTTPQAQLAELERNGQIPRLERDSTLQGVDLNGNGIRDDIEAYIASQYPAAPQRAAATQTAKALQAALTVLPTDVAAAKVVSRRISNAINCVFAQFEGGSTSKDPARVVKELEAITTNTKARLLAYLAYNKALDGTSSALPDGGTCE